MKKYILPLILILCLTFTLTGFCWVAGYDQRIKLTIDNTKIDTANLTWFPVTVFLTGSQAEEIFSELDADADYMKVAFTKADGETELYAECELFAHENIKSNFETGGDSPGYLGDGSNVDYWIASKFTIGMGFSCDGASIYLTGQNGNPTGDITFRIETDVGSEPSGTLAHANATGTVANGDITTTAWNKASYTPFTLSAGTYWLVYYIPDQATDVRWLVQRDAAGGIGQAAYSTDHASNWILPTVDTYVIYYRIYGHKAIYHVSRDGWVITHDADTDFYMYYDNDHADNTTYIGAIDTTAGVAVWDSNFKAVYHMNDATTSTIKDSTSNNNDGTKLSANNPIQVVGKIGKGQSFTSDYITMSDNVGLDCTTPTVEALIKAPSAQTTNYSGIVHKGDKSGNGYTGYGLRTTEPGFGVQLIMDSGNSISTTVLDNTYQYFAATEDGTNSKIYFNGTEEDSDLTGACGTNALNLYLGRTASANEKFTGIIDEARVSNIARSAAWIKATYNSLWDTLLTYGSEETAPSGTNVLFIFSNF